MSSKHHPKLGAKAALSKGTLELLKAHPHGLTYAEIIEQLEYAGGHEAELTRTDSIFAQNEKYAPD